jgi:hypothetical protein
MYPSFNLKNRPFLAVMRGVGTIPRSTSQYGTKKEQYQGGLAEGTLGLTKRGRVSGEAEVPCGTNPMTAGSAQGSLL